MSIRKFERIRVLSLVALFILFSLLSASFLFSIFYSFYHLHKSFPYDRALFILVISALSLIIIISLCRWLWIRKIAATNPSLRAALNDEQENTNRLKAYRVSFFALLILQLVSKMPILIWRVPWDVPFQSPFSISVAGTIYFGAFLYYNRERRHE